MNRRKFLCLGATGAAATAIAPALPAAPPDETSYDQFLDYLMQAREFQLTHVLQDGCSVMRRAATVNHAWRVATARAGSIPAMGHPNNLQDTKMQNENTETTSSEIYDLAVNTLVRTANFLRGMSMDPRLPMDRRDALEKRANKIDEFVAKHIK